MINSMDRTKGAHFDPKRILVMVAVEGEKEAVLRGINGDERFDVEIAGVGPILAAARTATFLLKKDYDLVINAGIAGAFPGRADIGSIVVSSEIICGDLGVETSEGFMAIESLNFGTSRYAVDDNLTEVIMQGLQRKDVDAYLGGILTLSTVTGTADKAEKLMAREQQAVAEAMEGFGVATASADLDIPVVEIRAISNFVGPRDKSAWRIDEAFQSLEKACSILTEVL